MASEAALAQLPTAFSRQRKSYRTYIGRAEFDERELWKAVQDLDEDDKGEGARMVVSQHRRAINGILNEHQRRLFDRVGEKRGAAEGPPGASLDRCETNTEKHGGFKIFSDRGTATKKRDKATTFEAHLLPSLGYRTREDAERWAWRFMKVNPGLKAVVR